MRYGIYHVYQAHDDDTAYTNFDDNDDRGYSFSEAMASVSADIELLYGTVTINCDGDLADEHRVTAVVTNDVYRQRWSIYQI